MPPRSDGAGSDNDESEDACDGQQEILAAVSAARRSMHHGHHRDALLQLLSLASSSENFAEALEELILAALLRTVETLAKADAKYLFTGARKVLPRSCSLVVAEGGFLHRHGEHLRALRCFEEALQMDPQNACAAESLESLRSFAAERWHFRMLNDRVRNSSYDAAITRAVSMTLSGSANSPPLVLDVGCGTGILSLMAARAGCSHVWGVEMNSLMSEMARTTVARHPSLASSVTIFNAHSSSLSVPDQAAVENDAPRTDTLSGVGRHSAQQLNPKSGGGRWLLPQPVDLVVTELVDSGLVGEHMIAVLRHAASGVAAAATTAATTSEIGLSTAASRPLLRPGGRMIPAGATLYALPIEAPDLRCRQRIMSDGEFDAAFSAPQSAFSSVSKAARATSSSSSSEGTADQAAGTAGAAAAAAAATSARAHVPTPRNTGEEKEAAAASAVQAPSLLLQGLRFESLLGGGMGNFTRGQSPQPPLLSPGDEEEEEGGRAAPKNNHHNHRHHRCGRRLRVRLDEAYTCEALDSFSHRPLAAAPARALDLDFVHLARAPKNAEAPPLDRRRRQSEEQRLRSNRGNAQGVTGSALGGSSTEGEDEDEVEGGGGGSSSSSACDLLRSETVLAGPVWGGVVDAVAVWFDLILDPGSTATTAAEASAIATGSSSGSSSTGSSSSSSPASESPGGCHQNGGHPLQGSALDPIVFSTAPGRPECGWDQGLYPLQDSWAAVAASGSSSLTPPLGSSACLVRPVVTVLAPSPASPSSSSSSSSASGASQRTGQRPLSEPEVVLETTLRHDDTLAFRLRGQGVARCCPHLLGTSALNQRHDTCRAGSDLGSRSSAHGAGRRELSEAAKLCKLCSSGDGGGNDPIGGGGGGEEHMEGEQASTPRDLALGEMDLAALNDRPRHRALLHALKAALRRALMTRPKESATSASVRGVPGNSAPTVSVLELCGTFSLVGLCAAVAANNDNNSGGGQEFGGGRPQRRPPLVEFAVRPANDAHAEILHALFEENESPCAPLGDFSGRDKGRRRRGRRRKGHDLRLLAPDDDEGPFEFVASQLKRSRAVADDEEEEEEEEEDEEEVEVVGDEMNATATEKLNSGRVAKSGGDGGWHSAETPPPESSSSLSCSSSSLSSSSSASTLVVVADVVEGCGLLRQGALEELQALHLHFAAAAATAAAAPAAAASSTSQSHAQRPFFSSCSAAAAPQPSPSPSLVVLPRRIALSVVPIECEALRAQNEVRSDAAPGLDLSALNALGVRLFRELNLAALPHAKLAPVVTCCHHTLNLDQSFSTGSALRPDTSSSSASSSSSSSSSASSSPSSSSHADLSSSPVPSLSCSQVVTFTIDSPGTVNAIAFWWQLGLLEECDDRGSSSSSSSGGAGGSVIDMGVIDNNVIDTGPVSVGGARGSHWRQAAVALRPPRRVLRGEELSVAVSMGTGVSGGTEIRLLDTTATDAQRTASGTDLGSWST